MTVSKLSFFYFVIILLSSLTLCAQNDNGDIIIDLDDINNSNERTEIQRYIGYEELLTRYLTLPYDICANTSKQGRYFDISYVILALFPLCLLLLTYKKKKIFWSLLIVLILYLGLSIDTSFVNIDGIGSVEKRGGAWDVTDLSQATASQLLLVNSYDVLSSISTPIKSIINLISGDKDHITYIFLFLLLLISIGFSKTEIIKHSKYRFLTITSLVFFFLWLYLSGGIIWYGFILIPLLYAFILLSTEKAKRQNRTHTIFIKVLVLVPITFWVISSYAARISNVNSSTIDQNTGKTIVDPSTIYYSTGLESADQSRRRVYNNIGGALEEINSNNELIYQVGSSLAFEIKNSAERCFQDNLLSMYYYVMVVHKDMKITGDILKASGFKYIIVDLYTYTLDKTPEQSLTKKYQVFINSLYESKNLRLMATDRVLEINTPSGQILTINHLFSREYGLTANTKLKNHGSYAIFEIL